MEEISYMEELTTTDIVLPLACDSTVRVHTLCVCVSLCVCVYISRARTRFVTYVLAAGK